MQFNPPTGHKVESLKIKTRRFFTCSYKIQLSTGNSVNKFIQFSQHLALNKTSDPEKNLKKAIKGLENLAKWNELHMIWNTF